MALGSISDRLALDDRKVDVDLIQPTRMNRAVQLTPNDFQSPEEVEERLLAFQTYSESIARPFEWRFARDDLAALLRKLDGNATALAVAA